MMPEMTSGSGMLCPGCGKPLYGLLCCGCSAGRRERAALESVDHGGDVRFEERERARSAMDEQARVNQPVIALLERWISEDEGGDPGMPPERLSLRAVEPQPRDFAVVTAIEDSEIDPCWGGERARVNRALAEGLAYFGGQSTPASQKPDDVVEQVKAAILEDEDYLRKLARKLVETPEE